MKKALLALLILISFSYTAYSSEIDSSHVSTYMDTAKGEKHIRKNFFAVNATFFLKQLLTFTSQNVSISSSPYIFDYRYVPHSSGFRLSAGFAYNQSKRTIPASQTGNGFDEVDKNHVLNVSFRLGYVYQKKIAKRWTIIVGADLIGTVLDSAQNVTTGSDNTSNRTKGWSIGLGPSLGIQFDISKRMGLYTETAIYYTYGSASVNNSFSSFQQQNDIETVTSNGLNFIVPLSIFYYIRF